MRVKPNRAVAASPSPWLLIAGAALVFIGAAVVAHQRPLPAWELDLTEWVNDAPDWLGDALWPVMQLGTVWAPIVIGLVAMFVYTPSRGVAVIASGISAWFLAKLVKDVVERGRPLQYIPDINVREGTGTGLGFVSGHTAVAFAIATAVMPVLPRWGRVAAYAMATLVAVSRIVYGVHLPVDVIGGACLGILCGCGVELVLRPLTGLHAAASG